MRQQRRECGEKHRVDEHENAHEYKERPGVHLRGVIALFFGAHRLSISRLAARPGLSGWPAAGVDSLVLRRRRLDRPLDEVCVRRKRDGGRH